MYDGLVKRLREAPIDMRCAKVMCEAADAIEELTGFVYEAERDRDEYRERLDKSNDAIEELSRRETPMRVRATTSTKRCPSCNKQLSGIGNIHRNYRFCRWCGQALDWTEPPKEETERAS